MPKSVFDLTGKTIVITGSTKGIGRAIAEAVARQGANVVISSRKQDACEEVAKAITAEGGIAFPVAAHIGQKEALQNLIDKTKEKFGKIDVLISNAAVNPYYGPLSGLDDGAFAKVMDSNVRSNIWLANMALPDMAKRKDGTFIIVSSIGGLRGTKVLGGYAISKAADFQLCRNLAVEWGEHNIRVNCIAPGLVRTDFARALWENPENLARAENATPLKRIGNPEDIAGAAVFLSSDSATWMTGQVIVIDGGVTIS